MAVISEELLTNLGTGVSVKVCVAAPDGAARVVNDCITVELSKRGIRVILPLPSSITMKVALVMFSFVWSRPGTLSCFTFKFCKDMLFDVPVHKLVTVEPVVLAVK